MSPFIVKICGITCEEDARIAVEAGANALGFNFYRKSPRYVAPEIAAEIMERVSGDYLKVGVFVLGRPDAPAGVEALSLDVIQLHGRSEMGEFPPHGRIWRALPAGAAALPGGNFEAFLLDTATRGHGGSGQTFDWNLARGLSRRVIVAGGLDGTNVAEAIRIAQPWGVDACSRLECAPGKKDAQRVRTFLRAALAAMRASEEIKV